MTDFEHQGRTDRLETVLQAILDTQQTGTLDLERGKGGVREKGSITLLYGQVFEASAGGRSGTEALKWLRTWGTCQYVFLSKIPSDIVALPPAPPTPGAASPAPANPPPAVPIPPPLIAQQAANRTIDTRRLQYTPPPAIPPAPIIPEATFHVQQAQSQNTGPLVQEPHISQIFPTPARPVPSGTPGQPFQSYPPYQAVFALQPSVAHVPRAYRLVEGSEALIFMDRVGLTRQHRHIFLLLDGQRTANDLVRLTRRPPEEVQHLLKDLERYGLIKLE